MKRLYTCNYCKKAYINGEWTGSWHWKTERGYKGHKCYKRVIEALQSSLESVNSMMKSGMIDVDGLRGKIRRELEE